VSGTAEPRSVGDWSSLSAAASASVIICAFNEEEHIGRLLDSRNHQTHQQAEVIVVDDGSVDETSAIAMSRGVRTLRVPHRGPPWVGTSARSPLAAVPLDFLSPFTSETSIGYGHGTCDGGITR
jgi:cellulose synthase/poly-beta-1,6-N-acetylglucosamine synthase-like glycosyltransferase